MDATDQSILDCLKANARATSSEISRKVSLSIPAVAERIRKMEQSGVIERSENADPFTAAVVKYPAVLECHHIAGEYDYLLKVLTEDAKTLDLFLSKSLKKIRGVARSNTIIALSTFKEELNP